MTKWINASPLEEIENSFLWQNANIEFEKTLSNNFDPFNDNVINRDFDSDTQTKIIYSLKNEKQFIHPDEPFKKAVDTPEENIINNRTLLSINNIFFNSIKYYKYNNINNVDENFGYISDFPLEDSFQASSKECINNLLDIDFEKLYFLPYEKKNIVPLNKVDKKHFLIKKVNKVDKENTNSTNEKTDEKKESANIAIIIPSNVNTGKKDINFIGKKRKIFKVIYEKSFNIFNYGEYDDYSKKMINEALNENNKQPDNVFAITKYKNSKKTKKKSKKNLVENFIQMI